MFNTTSGYSPSRRLNELSDYNEKHRTYEPTQKKKRVRLIFALTDIIFHFWNEQKTCRTYVLVGIRYNLNIIKI